MTILKPFARIANLIWPRRALARLIVGLCITLVAVVAGAAAFVLSDAGRDALAPRIVAALAPEGGAITYGALEGDWPRQIIAKDVRIRDRDGEWFSADRVELDWAPWRLLQRVADVSLLRVEHPRIVRMPVEEAAPEPAEKETAESTGLKLPVDVHLRALQIVNGEMVAPVATGFKAEGRADIEKGRVLAQLDAARVGGPDEHVHLDGAFDTFERTLHLDGDVKTAPQGLLAALVGVPDLPPVALTVKGSGPADNWALALAGTVEGYGAAKLDGTLAWRETVALDLSGTLTGGKELGPFVRRLMADGVTLDAHWTREGGSDEVKAAASSAAADLNVNLELGAETLLKARVLTGSISTQTKQPLVLSDDARIGAFTGSATLSGSINAPDISTTFEAEDVVAEGVHARGLKGVVALESREGAQTRYHAKASGTAEDVTQDGQSLLDTASWAFDATQQGDDYELAELTVSGPGLDVAASGHFNEKTGVGAGEAKLAAAQLAALSPFVGEDLDGAGEIEVKASRSDAAAPWQVDMTGTTQDLVIAGTELTPLAGPSLEIAATGTVAGDGAIALSAASVKGATLALTGKGALSPKLDATVTADGDLAVLEPLADLSASGPLKATVKAKGTLAKPQLDIAATSDAALIEDYNVGRLSARLTPQSGALFSDSTAHIEAKGPLGSAKLDAPVKHADHRWTVGPMAGSAYGAKITGTIGTAADGTSGNLKFVIGDLATAAPFLLGEGTKAQGRAQVELAFRGKDGIRADVTARGLVLPDSELSVSRLTATAVLGDTIDIASTFSGGELPGVHSPIYYDRLTFNAKGPRDAIKVALTSAGLTGAGGSLSAHGLLNLAAPTRTLDLEDLSGRVWDNNFALAAPARASFGAAGVALTPAQLRLDASGDITVSYTSDRTGQRGDLQLSGLGVPFLGRVLGVDWPKGAIDGAAKFDTAKSRAGGTVRFTLNDAYFTQATMERMTPMHGSVTGDWNGKVFTLDSSFSRDKGTPIIVQGRLPLEARGADGFTFNPRGAVAGQVQWEGRVGTLWTFLPLDLYRVDGDGKLAVDVAGTWGTPRINGRFDLNGGTFEGLSTGTRLSNLKLAIDANATSARYTLTGQDSGSGKLESEGKVTFDTERHFPLEGTLDMSALRVIGLDELSAIATGHAAVSGAMDAMLIKGDLTFDRVDALIPDKLPPSVPTLPVTYTDTANGGDDEAIAATADDGAVALDIKVHVPTRASLNGRGLTSEWRGDLAISGTTMTPVVTGEAKLQRGTLAFAGRSFPLTRGTVTFDGGKEIDPWLDVAAVRTVNSVAITLAVTGRSSAPKISITSDPTVPQDEAMALLLLGKSAGSLTPLELLDVARAVATLSGNSIGGGGLDVVDRARRALGLDVLTIDTSTGAGDDAKNITSSASLSAGRYVTDKVYVGVKQGAQTGSSAVELEIELTPNITATTEVGEQTGSSAGINWKWDY